MRAENLMMAMHPLQYQPWERAALPNSDWWFEDCLKLTKLQAAADSTKQTKRIWRGAENASSQLHYYSEAAGQPVSHFGPQVTPLGGNFLQTLTSFKA